MLIIATFNIQNDKEKCTSEKSKVVIDFLKEKHIDILGLQEVYPNFEKEFQRELAQINFKMYGQYRFKHQKIMQCVNETVPIITNKRILRTEVHHLPYLPTLLKRVITKVELQDQGHTLSVYNTHLDFLLRMVKKKQLRKILEIIKKDSNPLILMGDFNLTTEDKIFKDFVLELDKLGIKKVPLHGKTYKGASRGLAIDHLFVSKDYKIIETKIVKNLATSDHYPVLIKIAENIQNKLN